MRDDQNAGHFDDDDPLDRLQRQNYSWRPALRYAGAVVGGTFLAAVAIGVWHVTAVVGGTFLAAIIIGVISAVQGGPNCDDGTHVFICSRWAELALPLVPGAVSLFGALGCFWITYLRWKNFGNWRPWLAMCWVLMPWTLAWMTSTFSIAMFGVEAGTP